MFDVLRRLLPRPIISLIANSYPFFIYTKYRYLVFGRPSRTAESAKAYERRCREGFFDKFCQGSGLDIGYGGDLLASNCRGFDIEDGDAQLLNGIDDNSYDFVYSSHTLEHMNDPSAALLNWWRVLKPGGYLIVYIPHRDLYEKRKELPSNWNSGHRKFFLPENDELPDTLGLIPLIASTLSGYEIQYWKTCSEGHTITDPEIHSDGEYSIEAVLKKN